MLGGNADKFQSPNIIRDIKNKLSDFDAFEKLIEDDNDNQNLLIQYDGTCVRNKSNWTIGSNAFKFDNSEFKPAELRRAIELRSPKSVELIKNIKKLDEEDMKRDGKHYKHFIFSDLKNGLYGAKMLASVLIASGGYTLGYDAKYSGNSFKKMEMKTNAELSKTKYNNFYLLSSVGVYERPITVSLKKEILKRFNERPDNAHGENIRFIIMDSGFKEGIDLYDIKYIHIFEPQTTAADQKQVIGRGTRTCGQKGLLFNPRSGWPLHVYNYDLDFAPKYQPTFNDSQTSIELYLKSVGIDFRMFQFTSDLERLTILGSVDYELNKKIHEFSAPSTSTSRSSKSKSLSRTYGGSRYMYGGLTSTKSKTQSTAPVKLPRCPKGFHRNKKTKTCRRKRCPIGQHMNYKTNRCEIYTKKRNYVRKIPSHPHPSLASRISSIPSPPSQHYPNAPPPSLASRISSIPSPPPQHYPNAPPPSLASKTSSIPSRSSLVYSGFRDVFQPNMQEMNFQELREYVRTHFSAYSWEDIKMENLCGYAGPTTSQSKTGGGKTDLIQFTPTQNFIRHYFTPNNPIRGMILWHSVGTGKTCSAIAAATTAFEPLGYTILWVTRTTLKNDIWKNMFDQVCHEQFRQDKLKNTPDEMAKRMSMLSPSWSIRPMSYKQFSNMVSKKNAFYEALVKKNGTADPLRKTLLIIDEAHKLYGGTDLSSIERPDMNAFHSSLMNSYLVSGDNSVKLMLMTATPITNDPMELIKLINLCKLPNKQMPTLFDAFANEYLDLDEGLFTENGMKRYFDNIAGHVSYLNRERDVRQFAQPILHTIKVPLVNQTVETMIRTLDKSNAKMQINQEIKPLLMEQEKYMKQLENEYATTDKYSFNFIYKRICGGFDTDKTCNKVVKRHIQEIMNDVKFRKQQIKNSIDELKLRIKEIKEHYKITGKINSSDLNKYKETTYYNLKNTCGKKVETETQLVKNILEHPTMIAMDDQIADLESKAVRLKNDIQIQLNAYNNRLQQLNDELRNASGREEKANLKSQLQGEKKKQSEFDKTYKTKLKRDLAIINETKKQLVGRKKTTLRKVRSKFNKTLKTEKNKLKQIAKKLRKEQADLKELADDDRYLHDEFKILVKEHELDIVEQLRELKGVEIQERTKKLHKKLKQELVKTHKNQVRIRKKAEDDYKKMMRKKQV